MGSTGARIWLIGGVVAAIGLVLPWISMNSSFGGSGSANAFDMMNGGGPVDMQPMIAIVAAIALIVAALLAIASPAATKGAAIVALVAGIALVWVTGRWYMELSGEDDQLGLLFLTGGSSPLSILSIGWWLCLGGGIVGAVGGLIGLGAKAAPRAPVATPGRPGIDSPS